MFYTYILTNAPYGTLYTGHTDDLWTRVEQHRQKVFKGFSAKYDLHRLVWYEEHNSRHDAFTRERQIKAWQRRWKIRLIEEANPRWLDLHDPGDLLEPAAWLEKMYGSQPTLG